MAARPPTLAELKALAQGQRHLRLAGREPTLAEMRASRVARVAGLPDSPHVGSPGQAYMRPAWVPGAGGFVVPEEPLSRLRLAAHRKLGLEPAGIPRSVDLGGGQRAPAIIVPETYRPLAGLSPNNRGNTLRIDSTLFNAAVTTANPYGYFPTTTIVQAKSPGDDAEQISVVLGFQLSKPLVAGALTNFDTRVRARITWGLGGAEFTAQCDWLNGTVFSLPANYLRVEALVPDNASNAGNSAPLFLLSAGYGYGAPPASQNRARLTKAASTSLGVALNVEIPDFAIGYNLIGASGSGPYLVSQQDSGASGLVLYEHIFSGFSNAYGQGTNFYPIGNGADIIVLTNLAPGATEANMSFIFQLAF